jgi:hypothetical protein
VTSECVLVEILALELVVEVIRQVVIHELGRERVVRVDIVDAPVGVVHCGVERAGGDEFGELWERLVKLMSCTDSLSEVVIFRCKIEHQFQRMCEVRNLCRHLRNPLGEFLHRRFGLITSQL